MLNSCERNVDFSQVGSKIMVVIRKIVVLIFSMVLLGSFCCFVIKVKEPAIQIISSDRLLSALIASAFLIWLFRSEGEKSYNFEKSKARETWLFYFS